METGVSAEQAAGLMEAMGRWMDLQEVDPRTYSPLVLAYIGDAVYELVIRTKVVNRGSIQVNKLSKRTMSLVKAQAQAEMIRLLQEDLTDEELAVFKRGRNAKSVTASKHASVIDYRTATGLEALIGYLYLDGRYERMVELIRKGLEKIGEFS